MESFNFRWLLLSASFLFLPFVEIHCSQKFCKGLRVERELSVLTFKKKKSHLNLKSSSEALKIGSRKEIYSQYVGNVLSVFL